MAIHKYTVQESQNLGLGQAGSTFLDTDATSATGTYVAITMVKDTIFDTLTDSSRDGDAVALGAGGDTFPKGLTIFGSFTAISIESGMCICYKG